jgi:hypothetical protein
MPEDPQADITLPEVALPGGRELGPLSDPAAEALPLDASSGRGSTSVTLMPSAHGNTSATCMISSCTISIKNRCGGDVGQDIDQ